MHAWRSKRLGKSEGVSGDKMTLNEIQRPARFAGTGHMGNVGSRRGVYGSLQCPVLIWQAAVVFGLVALASFLSFRQQMPEGYFGVSWPARTLQNWYDYGYCRLGGRVVTNPGGIRTGETLQLYPGYRGFSLLPLHALDLVTGDLWWSTMIFFLLLSVGLAYVIWLDFGQTTAGLVIGTALCLSPGFAKWGITLDPVPETVFLGIPVLIMLLRTADPIRHPKPTLPLAAAVAVIMLYAQIEWAAALALFVAWPALAVELWPSRRARLGVLTVAMCIGILFGAVLLVFQKRGGTGAGSSVTELISFYRAYNFGPSGYGHGEVTWLLALKRLSAPTAVGLLPLWIVLATTLWHARVWQRPRLTVALMPLAVALCVSLAMRNSMATHQWIPCSFIGLGILFSLRLLLRSLTAVSPTPSALHPIVGSRWFLAVLLIFAFGIDRVVGAVTATKDSQAYAVCTLVGKYTPRSATICVGPDLQKYLTRGIAAEDAVTSEFALQYAAECWDRHFASLTACTEGGPVQQAFVVNSKPLMGYGPLVATVTGHPNPVLVRVLRWYAVHITRRLHAWLWEGSINYYLYKFQPRTHLPLPSPAEAPVRE
jgi:hypothetical protein